MSGADMSARPIATICCSPPLMVRAACPYAPRGAETVPARALRFSASPERARRAKAPSIRFAHVSSPKSAPLAPAPAGFDDLVCRPAAYVRSTETHLRARFAAGCGHGLSSEVLAATVGAEYHRSRPRQPQRHVVHGAVLAVGDAEPAISSIGVPQIGADHLVVRQHLAGQALGDHAAAFITKQRSESARIASMSVLQQHRDALRAQRMHQVDADQQFGRI